MASKRRRTVGIGLTAAALPLWWLAFGPRGYPSRAPLGEGPLSGWVGLAALAIALAGMALIISSGASKQ